MMDHRKEIHVQVQDNIDGVFQYKNLSASAIQGKSKVKLDIPPEGIAFRGEKNIYILTQGAAELILLDEISARVPVVSGLEKYAGVRLKLERPQKNDAVIHFSDELLVRVNKKYSDISEHDINAIEQAGFWKNDGRYIKKLRIEGVILPRGKHENIFSAIEPMKKKHQIELYTTDSPIKFHPLRLATNIVLTPLTGVVDIVFFPISLRVLGVISNPPGP